MNRLNKYQQINLSYKKKLIFHLGAEAGFYSEFNNMVSAILYCLKHEYQFILYSRDANFGYKNGWTDYFLPFCAETNFFIHRLFNNRTSHPVIRKKQVFRYIIWKIYRTLNKNTYFTFELWDEFYSKKFDNEYFNLPLLEIHGNLREASAIIAEMIYRFNKRSISKLDNYIHKIKLPNEYISLHIRRGDKNLEWTSLTLEEFMNKASPFISSQNIFLLTDDYTVIEEICSKYPQWRIFTLTNKTERGYIHNDFVNLKKKAIEERIIKLLASIEIIKTSSLFIGTYTTNVGLFIGMCMPNEKVISIQKKEWFQFSTDDVSDYVSKQ